MIHRTVLKIVLTGGHARRGSYHAPCDEVWGRMGGLPAAKVYKPLAII